MTTITERPTVAERDVIEQVIYTVNQDGNGEVFAEDVAAVMAGLNLAPQLYAKVASTLEDVCKNRVIAAAFADDPKHAYDKYVWSPGEGRVPMDAATAEYFENSYLADAEQGISLLIGLAALSC